ncbi:hypothetical protein JCGZ_10045 [Jatropha curcas]|uniref:Uncharacterized protein n=1 Tax=Jatropha curcas TaxID=180498 RepID=A0A067LN29_JATCU|nr:uncharacterized protein LOC105631804 [Jatropha curcas]KDP46205.1 hypothetical protein JCGZ_10045 [Jatropha curcas]
MGNCVAPQYTKTDTTLTLTAQNWQYPTTKIVHIDGKLQELKQPTMANVVLSQNLNCFLCSSESMYVNCHVPHVPDDEELQLGQIYFLLPLSKSNGLLSLQELCALAIKASAALNQLDSDAPSSKTTSFNGSKLLPAGGHRFCKIPIAFDIVGVNFPAGKDEATIKLI